MVHSRACQLPSVLIASEYHCCCGTGRGKKWAPQCQLCQSHRHLSRWHLHLHLLSCCRYLGTLWDEERWLRRCLCKLLRCPRYPRKVSLPCTGHCPGSCRCTSSARARLRLDARRYIAGHRCTCWGDPRNSCTQRSSTAGSVPSSSIARPGHARSRTPTPFGCSRTPGH